jgi:hypothetical protein
MAQYHWPSRVRGRRICYEAVLVGWFESLEHWGTLWSLGVPGAGGRTGKDRIPFPLATPLLCHHRTITTTATIHMHKMRGFVFCVCAFTCMLALSLVSVSVWFVVHAQHVRVF